MTEMRITRLRVIRLLLPCLLLAMGYALSGGLAVSAQAPGPGPTKTVVLRQVTLAVEPAATLSPTPGSRKTDPPPQQPQPTVTPAQTVTATPSSGYPPPGDSATQTAAAGVPTTAPATPTGSDQIPWEERPILLVDSHGTDPGRPAAGAGFRLSLSVKNVGEHLAENVRLSISSASLVPGSDGGMLYRNKIEEGDSAGFDTQMHVSAGAAPGVHSMTIGLQWDDSYGGTYSDQATIGVDVAAGQLRPSVIVTAARMPGRVAPGIPFTLSLDLVNSGGRDARDVLITLLSGPLAPSGSGAPPVFLSPGSRTTVDIKAIASTPPEPGAASQTLELRYEDPDGERYTDQQNVGLVVTGDGATGPVLVVGTYSVQPEELHPGEVFDVNLNIENVGATDASRARVVLGGGSSMGDSVAAAAAALGPFAPLGTGNVRYIGRISAGDSESLSQQMVVDGSAKPGVYTLSLGLEYVDTEGRERVDNQQVTLLVSRKVDIQIRQLDPITQTLVGDSFDFEVEITNAGGHEVTVSRAEVDPGRYMSVERGEIFVGPLGSGDLDVLDAVLTPKAQTDDATVTVVVHYVDDFNRQRTVEETYHFEIDERPESPIEDAGLEQASDSSLGARVLKGLFGLGASAPYQPGPSAIGDSELAPIESELEGEPATEGEGGGGVIIVP